MNILVPVALIGWVPVVLLLFALLKPRQAVITAFVAGWLFLPVAGYKIPGFLTYSKEIVVPLSVLLCALVFDPFTVVRFRPRWIDLPMLAWCAAPFASSMSNGLGPYDGVSAVIARTLLWGVSYLIGRAYFCDAAALRSLAVGIFVGGLAYAPLCLFEIRMSPQLHHMVYGIAPQGFEMTMRFGGWRPTVFMPTGLMVGMWMAMASLAGLWLWRHKMIKRAWGMPAGLAACGLLLVTIACKSVGAIALVLAGYAALRASTIFKSTAVLLLLCAVPLFYCAARATGAWSGRSLDDAVAALVSKERADSLKTRLDNEDQLAAKALQRPIFGWGGWGAARVFNDQGENMSITDGLWIIALGDNGLVGLTALLAAHLLPCFLLWWASRGQGWPSPGWPLAHLFSATAALVMIDNLFNAMVNPIFILVIGAAVSAAVAARQPRIAVAAARPQRRAATHAAVAPTPSPQGGPRHFRR